MAKNQPEAPVESLVESLGEWVCDRLFIHRGDDRHFCPDIHPCESQKSTTAPIEPRQMPPLSSLKPHMFATSIFDSHDVLQSQCDAGQVWNCTLPFQEAYCMQDESSLVSLTQKMVCNSVGDYMFPECYYGEDSIEKLQMEVKLAALLDGFNLVVGRTCPHDYLLKKNPKSKRYMSFTLECDRHRLRRGSTLVCEGRYYFYTNGYLI